MVLPIWTLRGQAADEGVNGSPNLALASRRKAKGVNGSPYLPVSPVQHNPVHRTSDRGAMGQRMLGASNRC